MIFNLKTYYKTWQELQNRDIITPFAKQQEIIELQIFDRLDSTNNKLWELIDNFQSIPLGAIALEQTAGKGQWGSKWVSAIGGLYLSVALNLDLELQNNFHLTMATVWGIAKVLRAYELPVTIKWSNDLILDNCKLGGIKTETRNRKNKIVQAVVGVGINWCNPVPSPGINIQSYYQKTSIKNITSLEALTAIACYGIVFGYEYYLAVGIEDLVAEYTAILNSIGKKVAIANNWGEIIGITQDGRLKVKLRSPGASSTITVAPGEISLGYDNF